MSYGIDFHRLPESVKQVLRDVNEAEDEYLVHVCNNSTAEDIFGEYLRGLAKSMRETLQAIERAQWPTPRNICPACHSSDRPCDCDKYHVDTMKVVEAVNETARTSDN